MTTRCLIDSADDYKMLIDPKSVYAINAAYSAGRQMDTEILTAAVGNSFAVSETDAQSNVALPSGQKIAYDFGGAAIGLTLAKVRRGKRILDDNEVDDDGRIIVITPQNLEEMLGITEVTSADYNSVKALVDGNLNTFLGFKWVRTTLLPYTDETNDRRAAVAYQRTGIGLGMGMMERVKISERADKNYSTQVYLEMGLGAVRIEEEKVVEISCDQSP
ncbi:MAG: phage capsid protein [Planctomycetota bacterium]